MLGRGDDGRFGGVGDDHASLRSSREVDVVHADSGATDHLEPLGALKQIGRHLRGAPDDDRVVVADRLGQVAVRLDVDFEPLSQELDPCFGDRLPDQNPLHGLYAATGSACASSAAGTAVPRSMSAPASTSARSSASSAAAMSCTST